MCLIDFRGRRGDPWRVYPGVHVQAPGHGRLCSLVVGRHLSWSGPSHHREPATCAGAGSVPFLSVLSPFCPPPPALSIGRQQNSSSLLCLGQNSPVVPRFGPSFSYQPQCHVARCFLVILSFFSLGNSTDGSVL